MPVIPAVPYMLTRFARCSVGSKISRGARSDTHINKKKRKEIKALVLKHKENNGRTKQNIAVLHVKSQQLSQNANPY